MAQGQGLSDHYDPKAKAVRLSNGVYNSTSMAALGIAAHEVGHAIQHSEEYAPLTIRNAIIPATNFGSKMVFPLRFNRCTIFYPTDCIYRCISVFIISYIPNADPSCRIRCIKQSIGYIRQRYVYDRGGSSRLKESTKCSSYDVCSGTICCSNAVNQTSTDIQRQQKRLIWIYVFQ